MEYAKIDDPDIPKSDRLPYETYLVKLYQGTYKGFNLLFGNVLNDPSSGVDLKIYQNMNLPFKTKFESPLFLQTGKVHGLSNGNLNEWWKVLHGRKRFIEEYITAEQKAVKIKNNPGELDNLMSQFGEWIHQEVLLNDERVWLSELQRTDEGLYHEYLISSTFVRNQMKNYATVSSTVLIIHKSGRAYMQEHSY